MASKTIKSNEQDLKNQLADLRNEKDRLLKVLNEREEQIANMFSYLQNLGIKKQS